MQPKAGGRFPPLALARDHLKTYQKFGIKWIILVIGKGGLGERKSDQRIASPVSTRSRRADS
eukprot:1319008-Amorphochlora_amoeboformis.AAC.2